MQSVRALLAWLTLGAVQVCGGRIAIAMHTLGSAQCSSITKTRTRSLLSHSITDLVDGGRPVNVRQRDGDDHGVQVEAGAALVLDVDVAVGAAAARPAVDGQRHSGLVLALRRGLDTQEVYYMQESLGCVQAFCVRALESARAQQMLICELTSMQCRVPTTATTRTVCRPTACTAKLQQARQAVCAACNAPASAT